MLDLKRINALLKQLSLSLHAADLAILGQPCNINPGNDTFTQFDTYLLKGDNLKTLLSLADKPILDFCYIDPPYHTGKAFTYNDNFVGNHHPIFGRNAAWMAYLLPRLVLIHALLKADAAIAISIDDHAQPSLRILMDAIFGHSQFVANICVERNKAGKGSSKHVATSHEYLVVYAKSSAFVSRGSQPNIQDYPLHDEHGQFRISGMFRKKGADSLREDRPSMYYPVFYDKTGKVFTENTNGDYKQSLPVDSKGIARRWLWGIDTARKQTWQLYASQSGTIYVKDYYQQGKLIKPRSLWQSPEFATSAATCEMKKIFGAKVFDTPKPTAFIRAVLDAFCKPDALILDAFAGSGTTAHAAYQLNQLDGGTRKVVLMETTTAIPVRQNQNLQMPWLLSIADITEQRLRYLRQQDTCYTFACEQE